MKNFNLAVEEAIETEDSIFVKIKYSIFWIKFTKEFLSSEKINIFTLKNATSISVCTKRELLTFLGIKSIDEIEKVFIIATKEQ